MKLVETVYEVAEEFMKNPTYVSVDYDKLEELVGEMKSVTPPKFPSIEEQDLFKSVLFELVGGAINYCYWYGRDDVRPGGASSTFMYENLQNAFFDYDPEKSISSFRQCIDNLKQNLTFSRFPLLEERIKHLYELLPFAEDYVHWILENDKENLEPLLNELVATFPGYASIFHQLQIFRF